MLLIFIASCNTKPAENEESIDEEVLDPKSSLNTNFDGKIFSIPSPVQTSMLIKEAKLPFTENLLNNPENFINYNNEIMNKYGEK